MKVHNRSTLDSAHEKGSYGPTPRMWSYYLGAAIRPLVSNHRRGVFLYL